MSYISRFVDDTTLNQYCDIFSTQKIDIKNIYVFIIDKTFSKLDNNDNNIEIRSKVSY